MGKRILIVDDAAFMRMMIKDILTKNNFEVVGEAADGAQAIEKYFDLKPDLVTMDITMPEMDGIAALKAIKEKDPICDDHHVFSNGATSDGHRCDSSWCKRLYRQTFPSRSCVEAIEKALG